MVDFSIIVPVLNEAQNITSCLAALQGQRIGRERFEIIVIDNGSTDGTLDIVRCWPDVVLLHEPKPDPYLARNRGIAAARVEFSASPMVTAVPMRIGSSSWSAPLMTAPISR